MKTSIMRLMRPLIRAALAVAILVILAFLAGCQTELEPTSTGNALSGAVQIDGSSTVFPITEAVAEEYMKVQPRVRVTVGVSGTGGGFAKFLRKETDLNDASRTIKQSELEKAAAEGIGFVELPVAYDGIAVIVNPQNDWVDCLTTDELSTIWSPGSQVHNWSQIRAGFPDRPLKLYGPGTDSGTYDYFTEAIGGESGASRSDFTASEDDNVLVQGIAGDEAALGFFGFAYYDNNKDRLKLLSINDTGRGTGCVAPDLNTISTGAYAPLSRPLFIYVRADRKDNPSVSSFVEFYLDQAAVLAEEVGYVALPQEAYVLVQERYRNNVTGTAFMHAEPGVTTVEILQRAAP